MIYDSVLRNGAYLNATVEVDYTSAPQYACPVSHKSDVYNLTFWSEPEDLITDKNKEGVDPMDPQYKYLHERQHNEDRPITHCLFKTTVRINSTSLVQVTVPYRKQESVKCKPEDTYKHCKKTSYLSEFCVKIKYSSAQERYNVEGMFPSVKKKSYGCYYNPQTGAFDMTKYEEEEPVFTNLLVRFSDDPYLTYQEETGGTGNFGMPVEDSIKTGLILTVLGVLVCMIEFHVFRGIYRYIKSFDFDDNSPRPTHFVGRFYYDSARTYRRRYPGSGHGKRPHHLHPPHHHHHNYPRPSYPSDPNNIDRSNTYVYQPTGGMHQGGPYPAGPGAASRTYNPLGDPTHFDPTVPPPPYNNNNGNGATYVYTG